MICPVCGTGDLIRDTRELTFTFRGMVTKIQAVTGTFCVACGESFLDSVESDRVMCEMRAFAQSVMTK